MESRIEHQRKIVFEACITTQRTVLHRGMGTRLMGTILIRAS